MSDILDCQHSLVEARPGAAEEARCMLCTKIFTRADPHPRCKPCVHCGGPTCVCGCGACVKEGEPCPLEEESAPRADTSYAAMLFELMAKTVQRVAEEKRALDNPRGALVALAEAFTQASVDLQVKDEEVRERLQRIQGAQLRTRTIEEGRSCEHESVVTADGENGSCSACGVYMVLEDVSPKKVWVEG